MRWIFLRCNYLYLDWIGSESVDFLDLNRSKLTLCIRKNLDMQPLDVCFLEHLALKGLVQCIALAPAKQSNLLISLKYLSQNFQTVDFSCCLHVLKPRYVSGKVSVGNHRSRGDVGSI